MKVLQIMAGAARGGAEAAYVDLCTAMKNHGWDIEAVTRSNDIRVPELQKAGVKVHTLPFGGRLDFYTPWKIKKIIQVFKPDIVQTWMARASMHVPRWSASMKIPRYEVVSRLGGYYDLKYFKSADYFIAVAPDIKTYLERAGIKPSRIARINNFSIPDVGGEPVKREDHGTPQEAPLLLALGRLHEAKALDVLIRAVAALPGIHLWIAGEGPERESLENLIAQTKTQDRITLLGWRTDRSALFAAADICVFPSRFEPFGTVFVQAWAHKTPLITTSSDGPRQFVRDGEDALVVPIDDDAALKNAILKLAGDQALQKKLSENGYQRFLNEFTVDKCLDDYKKLFQDIMKKRDQT